jgi:dTDP-4-amino-4,6-dideoxygalactose transaminase
VSRVLERGRYILGPETEAFEGEFARRCGVTHGVGVGSGTEAIRLALSACGVLPGSDVVTVANAGVPGPAAIRLAGARPVYADVDPLSQTMDPRSLENAMTEATSAILVVHLFGLPADLDPILEIGRRRGVPVVEDCAQAHGARYRAKPVGSFGAAGCFSFYPTKNLGAAGDAGIVVTSDERIAGTVRRLRQYGWESRFHAVVPGGENSRLDELQAAILRAKLPRLDEWNRVRREVARRYRRSLADTDLVGPPEFPDREHVFHLFVVRSRDRENLRSRLASAGVETDVHYPSPSHLEPAFADRRFPEGALPVSEQLAREILSIPCYPEMTEDEVDRVCASLAAR